MDCTHHSSRPSEQAEETQERNHGFIHIPEVQCSLTMQEAHDGGTLLKQVLESRDKRNAINENWRKILLEVWKLLHQDKNKENTDVRQLEGKKRQVLILLPEVEAANHSYQGCLEDYRKSSSTQEASVCSMSKSFWFPKNPVQMDSSPLSCTELDVKLCGSEVKTFSDATVGYIQEHFKPINDSHRVPPLLFFSDEYKRGTKRDGSRKKERSGNCKIGQLSYYSDYYLSTHPQLTEHPRDVQNICDQRRGLEAVELVGDKLIECHKCLPGGMFVISNLKHQKYLGNVRKSMKKKATPQVHVTAQDGDHDIIVIHRRIGVILIQVKGCTPSSKPNTKQNVIQVALQQVMMDRFVFYESNRDLDFIHSGKLPVYGFAAVPFLQKSDVEILCICKEHFDNILTECDLKCLHKWLEARVNIPVREEAYALTEDEYMMLCGRYVGLLSEVPMRTFKEGNKKLGQKIESLFLTPDQMALVNESKERFMCVCGDYGTGKSLVLVEKAKKLVGEDDSSIALVISCSDIDNYHLCKLNKPYKSADQMVERFLSVLRNSNISERVRVMQFGDVLRDMSGGSCNDITKITADTFHRTILGYVKKQNLAGKCHIFVDEVLIGLFLEDPFVSLEGFQLGSSWDNINSELPEGSVCWISVCPHSYKMRKIDKPSRIVQYLPRNFKWYYLDLIMRVSQSVCDLAKGIEDHIGKGHHIYSSVGHTYKGSKPLLLTLPDCPCSKGEVILCSCSSERLEVSLKKIKEHFDFKVLPVVIIMHLFHCGEHLLSLYRQFQRVLQKAFSEFDVKLEWNTMYGSQTENPYDGKTTISVVDQHTFIGCESRNVMCIDMFGMHQWFSNDSGSEWFPLIVNRCTAQYIHINWPEVEARTQWLAFLVGYELYCKEQGITPWEGIMAILNTARESKGLCVKSLREKQLFKEILMN